MNPTVPPFDPGFAINAALLAMLLVVAGAIVWTRSLLAVILLMTVYSLLCAAWFVIMDAPDVAFTEAAVGAGISTVVLLGAILLTRSDAARVDRMRLIFPGLVTAGVGAILVYAAFSLPLFGDAGSPANAYVGRIYLQSIGHDIGVPNVVTAVLASYRGFDTLGETIVIFAAGIGVALLLGFGERALSSRERIAPEDASRIGGRQVVLRVSSKLIIPLIALFAFYVQFHGDLGPGGGFQAGVILAVAVILHALVFGLQDTMAAVRPGAARGLAAIGVLVYAGVGVICMVNGGAFLDYDYLFPPEVEARIPEWILGASAHEHHWGQHFGILLVEIGVLLTVAATMVTVFYGFAGRAVDVAEDAR